MDSTSKDANSTDYSHPILQRDVEELADSSGLHALTVREINEVFRAPNEAIVGRDHAHFLYIAHLRSHADTYGLPKGRTDALSHDSETQHCTRIYMTQLTD